MQTPNKGANALNTTNFQKAHRGTHMGRTKNESRGHRMKKDQNSTYKAQLRARRKNALRERYQSRQKQDQHQNDGPSLMKGL